LFQVFDRQNSGFADYMEMQSMLQQDYQVQSIGNNSSSNGQYSARAQSQSGHNQSSYASDKYSNNMKDDFSNDDSYSTQRIQPSVSPQTGGHGLRSYSNANEASHIGNMIGGNLEPLQNFAPRALKQTDIHRTTTERASDVIYSDDHMYKSTDDITEKINLNELPSNYQDGQHSARGGKRISQAVLPPRINPALGRATAQARRQEFLAPQPSMNNIIEQHSVRGTIPPPGAMISNGQGLPVELIPLVKDIAHNIQKRPGVVRSTYEWFTQKRPILTKSDFMRGLLALNVSIQDAEAEAIMSSFSCKTDGTLSYSDFIRLINFAG
jgi:hypothetical protein